VHVFKELGNGPRPRALCASASADGKEQALSPLLYDDAHLYDVAVSFRDFKQEVDFIIQVAEEFVNSPLETALELAAGPAQHAVELARRGVAVVAIDNEKAMVELGKKKANDAGVPLQYIYGDMASFGDLPTADGKVQLVYVMFGSMTHMLTNDAVIGCLTSARGVLAAGGCILLELPHPSDVFNAEHMLGDAWEAEDKERNTMVLVEWGREGDPFDHISQVLERTVSIVVVDKNKPGEILQTKETTLLQRLFTAMEMDALVRASGLKIVKTYGALDTSVPLDDEENAFRMVVVLKPVEHAV